MASVVSDVTVSCSVIRKGAVWWHGGEAPV